MADWDDLDREVWYWAEQGRTATLWWRDDDAVAPNGALDRLLSLAATAAMPVGLAVIPRDAGSALADLIAPHPSVFVLQHGFSHANHAPDGSGPDEYGPERGQEERLAELADGRSRIKGFPRFVPALVPPWNRVPRDLLPDLAGIGLHGVSGWGSPPADAAGGVRWGNVHVDVMDWALGRFCGTGAVMDQLCGHLRARRTGAVPADEPTGLMTHHSWHDEGVWHFLAELFARTRPRPGIRWLSPVEVFA